MNTFSQIRFVILLQLILITVAMASTSTLAGYAVSALSTALTAILAVQFSREDLS